MAEQITIDEAKLTGYLGEFTTLHDESNRRRGLFAWHSSPDAPAPLGGVDVRANLSLDAAVGGVRAGAPGYATGDELNAQVGFVRGGLFERVDAAYQHFRALHWGLKNLLDDTDGTEQLNSISAQEFMDYLPPDEA